MSEPLVIVDIDGVPHPKGRPRFRVVKPRGKPQFVTTYTDAATKAYEGLVKAAAVWAMDGGKPLSGALSVTVEVFLPVAVSWPKRDRAAALAGELHPTSRSDIDNFCKGIFDGANGVVWLDDSQIVAMTAIKRYSDNPRARLCVWAFDDVEPQQEEMI